jgi:hypothetical protein
LRAIVKLSTGALAVFSPVSLTPEVRERVDSLGGNVKYIAAPDLEHHLHVSSWRKAYPQAEILAPEGLWEKRSKIADFQGEAPFEHVFKKDSSNAISEEFDAEFDSEYVHGHASRELVFLHRPSRTMIEADMLFNLPATEQYSKTPDANPLNCLTKVVLPMLKLGAPPTGQQRFAWHVLSQQDRSEFTASVKRIANWDFDRIIPCHGDVIETNGKSAWQDVMAWFLKDESKPV